MGEKCNNIKTWLVVSAASAKKICWAKASLLLPIIYIHN